MVSVGGGPVRLVRFLTHTYTHVRLCISCECYLHSGMPLRCGMWLEEWESDLGGVSPALLMQVSPGQPAEQQLALRAGGAHRDGIHVSGPAITP